MWKCIEVQENKIRNSIFDQNIYCHFHHTVKCNQMTMVGIYTYIY